MRQRAIQLAGPFLAVQNDTEDEVQCLTCSGNKGDDRSNDVTNVLHTDARKLGGIQRVTHITWLIFPMSHRTPRHGHPMGIP